MVTFTALSPQNNLDLNELDGLANFSKMHFGHRSFSGFHATSGDVDLTFRGSGFLYNPFTKKPFTGKITILNAADNDVSQFRFSQMSVGINHVKFFTQTSKLFAGNDILNGSNLNDQLSGLNGSDLIKGNNGSDFLFGGQGNDTLVGGRGADKFTGGLGHDRFDFTAEMNSNDRITDFNTNRDRIDLSHSLFAGIGSSGQLAANLFHEGSSATTPQQRIIYDPNGTPNAGVLYYDPDGSNSQAQTAFGLVNGHLHLNAGHFFVI